MQSELGFIPNTNTKEDAIRESYSSDHESDADFDASTDCGSDISDEDWMPDEDEVESDEENPVNYQKSEINWLKETQELYKESKSIVFDSQLKKLFQSCQSCGARIKFASLKQRGSLIFVRRSCEGGHTENWFSQPFTNGTATGNLVLSEGILYTGNHFASTNTFMTSFNIRFFLKKGNFNSTQRNIFGPWLTTYMFSNTEICCSH